MKLDSFGKDSTLALVGGINNEEVLFGLFAKFLIVFVFGKGRIDW